MEVFGMDKVKWSFSLLLAFFLVGILSTAAFASDLYSLKAVRTDSGLEVSFSGSPNVATDVAGTKFDLVLMNDSTTPKTYGPIALDNTKHGTFTIPSSDLASGKTYKIQLFYSSDTNHTTRLTGIVVADTDGSGIPNENQTGSNNLNKSRTGQNVHGAYQNNTNSCASCHQTHTANDNNLLLKDGVYSTCTACHDGTTGGYNYFSPQNAIDASNSISGTFDVSSDLAHGSLHQADGTLQISAAPGGNNAPDMTKGSISASTWGQDFDCASCHAPHGAGSADENNLNIDPMGWGKVQYYSVGATKADGTKATADDANGKLFKNITVQSSVPTTEGDPYILVKTTATGVSSNTKDIGYLYYRAGVKEGDPIIQTYRWDGSAYVPDYSLWLRDTGYEPKPFQKANTVFYDSTGKAIDITQTNMTAVWRDGFAFGSDISKVATADLSIGIDVETVKVNNQDDIAALYDSSDPNYIPDSGVEMTKYCTACHMEYMSKDPVTGQVGELTSLVDTHRHAVTDSMTCVRCHFAHGTKADIMQDSSGNLAGTSETLSATNHSSALRRYINTDSCYVSGCHSNDPGTEMYLEGTN
jgi:predicted CXXCH cytochrome family protein